MRHLLLFMYLCFVSFTGFSQNLSKVYTNSDGDSIVLSQKESYITYGRYIGNINKVKETKSFLIFKYQKESEHFQKFTTLHIEPIGEINNNEFINIQLFSNGLPVNSCGIYTYYKKKLSYCGDFDTIGTVLFKKDIFSDDSVFYLRFCNGKAYYPFIFKINSWNGDSYKIILGQSGRFYDYNFKKSDIIKCKKKKKGCLSCKFKTYHSNREKIFLLSNGINSVP